MAVRFDVATDKLSRTTNLPSITSFTLMCWMQIAVDRNAYSFVLYFGAVGGQAYSLGMNGTGTQFVVYTGADNNGTDLSVGTWYHIALTVAGTGAGQALGYLNGVLNITASGSSSPTAGKLIISQDDTANFANSRIAAVKIYGAVLTANEILTEMRCYMPVRVANLNSWLPLLSSGSVADHAGGGTWTTAGTLTTEDGPPIPWSIAPVRQMRPTAVVTPGGGIVRQMLQHAGG